MPVFLTLVYLSYYKFTSDDGPVNDFGQVIIDDKKGKLWIGTDTGISSYANRKFNNY